jgi:addiction module HigA family antidote
MRRFDDEKIQEIYQTRFCPGVPEHVSVAAPKLIHPLLAACSLQDGGVLGTIFRCSKRPDRYGLRIDGKWYVSFAWNDDFGAFAIRLERW